MKFAGSLPVGATEQPDDALRDRAEAYLTDGASSGDAAFQDHSARFGREAFATAIRAAALRLGRRAHAERLRPALSGGDPQEIVAVLEAANSPELGLWAVASEGARLQAALTVAAERHLVAPKASGFSAFTLALALASLGPLAARFDPLLATGLTWGAPGPVHDALVSALQALAVPRREALLVAPGRLCWALLWTCPTDRVVNAALDQVGEPVDRQGRLHGLDALGRRLPSLRPLVAALGVVSDSEGRSVLARALARHAKREDVPTLSSLMSDANAEVRENARAALHRMAMPATPEVVHSRLVAAVTECYQRGRAGGGWDAAFKHAVFAPLGLSHCDLALQLGRAFLAEPHPDAPAPYGFGSAFRLALAAIPDRQQAAQIWADIQLGLCAEQPLDALIPREDLPLRVVALASRVGAGHAMRYFDWLVCHGPSQPEAIAALWAGLHSADEVTRQVAAGGLRAAGHSALPCWPFEVDLPDAGSARVVALAKTLAAEAGYGSFDIVIRYGEDVLVTGNDREDLDLSALTDELCDVSLPIVSVTERFEVLFRSLQPLEFVAPVPGITPTLLSPDQAYERLRSALEANHFAGPRSRPLALARALVDALAMWGVSFYAVAPNHFTSATFETGFFLADREGNRFGVVWYVNHQ